MADDDQFDDIEREYAPYHNPDNLNYGNRCHSPMAEAFFLPATQELNFEEVK